MPYLVVVIASWNTVDLTQDCLRSLFSEINGLDAEVWVVDNNSQDDSVKMIKTEFPPVKLIENNENVGFAKANNIVLAQAVGQYYLLLNTDTVVRENSIKYLCRFLDDNPDVSAVGPKLINANGAEERPLKPLPTLSGELRYCLCHYFFPFERIFKSLFAAISMNNHDFTRPTQAEVLSAACLLIRRNVVEQVGLLAEDYFLFSEENDYFLRIKKKGLKAYYYPQSQIVHLIGMSRRKRESHDSYLNFLRSRLLFFKKHYPIKVVMVKILYTLFFLWSMVIAFLKQFIRHNSYYTELYKKLLRTIYE
jgi:GT2 family glycosyltransferase